MCKQMKEYKAKLAEYGTVDKRIEVMNNYFEDNIKPSFSKTRKLLDSNKSFVHNVLEANREPANCGWFLSDTIKKIIC